MNPADRHFMWVEWSDRDDVYIGRCPDLITGVHGDDPVKSYDGLRELVAEVIDDMTRGGEELPEPTVRPMRPAA